MAVKMRFILPVTSILVSFLLATCQTAPPDKDLSDHAMKLADQFIIVDTHIDVPYRMTEKSEDVSVRTVGGDFDYPRAREGGLNVPFMSIFLPAERQQIPGSSYQLADSLIDLVEGFVSLSPDKFAIAQKVSDVIEQKAEGLVSLAMGMENGSGIENNLENLTHFFDRGIRYITLTHGKDNLIGDSSYDSTITWNGLSPFGFQVVEEMNRLGIMVDISHVSDSTFFDVLSVTRAPVIASHSSVRVFTPGWKRNLSDEELDALGTNGGVAMIAFGSAFVRGEYMSLGDKAQEAIQNAIDERGLTGEEAFAYRVQQRRAYATGTVSDVVDHIDHIVQRIGIDHVGIGSDFDGVFLLPRGLQDVSKYPNLIEELIRRDYSDESIGKILGGNLLRVWKDVERIAGEEGP
jgi:membrane dipeptidase